MKRILMSSFCCVMFVVMASPAIAQSNPLIGSWKLIAADKLLPDGSRVSDYGAAPHGITVFTKEGSYVVEIFGTMRPKFASGDRAKGTPEEYKEAALSQSCHFGTYSLDISKGTISFNIERASYANWDETTQVRSFTIKGDTLSWWVPARADGSIPMSVFKRVQ